MKTRLHIDRLILKTHGMTPAAAEAAARALGPALANHLGQQATASGAIPTLNVTLPAAAMTSPALMAGHVAKQLSSPARPAL